MKIGNRVVEAKIDRRQAARESYEAARREGKRASLLEQERPNVFTMNVANIMPGRPHRVDMDYSEMLVPDEAVYEFVYPTGRRSALHGAALIQQGHVDGEPAPAGRARPSRTASTSAFTSRPASPLKELASPSHAVAGQLRRAGARRRDAGAGGRRQP
jgi:Ca-activated chloride channel family protein